jgi:hypothetical protein
MTAASFADMTHTAKVLGALFLCSLLNIDSAQAYSLFPTNATWRYLKGFNEASSPDIGAWRTNGFADTSFTDGPAPFTYGEGYTYGTLLNDMINSYTCVFLRRTFLVTNKTTVAALRFGAKVDDGFVVWINGTEVQRVNMGGSAGDPVTITTLAGGATEPVPFVIYELNTSTNYLLDGTNTIAVQVFNTTANSTDLVSIATWTPCSLKRTGPSSSASRRLPAV